MKFIGRIERGFDFLGYHFGPDGLSVAGKTFEWFVGRAARLYEQESGKLPPPPSLGCTCSGGSGGQERGYTTELVEQPKMWEPA